MISDEKWKHNKVLLLGTFDLLKFHCLTCSAMKMIHIFFCGNPNMICILSQGTFATVMDTLLGVNSGQLCGAANVCKFSSYCGKWCLALACWKVVVLLVTVVYHHIGSVLSAPNPCQRHLHWVIFYPASAHSKASVIDCILYNVILFESVALESCTVHTVNWVRGSCQESWRQ